MTTIPGRPVLLAMDDTSSVGEARRTAVAMAKNQGFDESGQGRVAIVATEAASNLVKHAKAGELVLRELDDDPSGGVEILSLDKGPGMADVSRFITDGVSTAGTPGNGLGAIARLSDSFAIHSVPELGTAALSRFWPGADARKEWPADLEIGAVSLPMAGEEVCGDSWCVDVGSNQTRILVVDGLGHGAPAAAAAREAVRAFREHAARGPEAVIIAAHDALRATRGAAIAVAQIDVARRELRFAGVGNIAASVLTTDEGRGFSLVSHNGTAGHALRRIQEFVHPWTQESLLVMHSDGLVSHWRLQNYRGLLHEHPGLVAGVLYRDFRRGRDDTTALVARGRRVST
ncbi:MAG: ATP-binding protein/SpoIIE family protein phosphatase [Isosphaeraceae bacterium]|nr:ATP-binding protein/SpoIIE family protein phosphatase [Isosphaeraceae bacterium]